MKTFKTYFTLFSVCFFIACNSTSSNNDVDNENSAPAPLTKLNSSEDNISTANSKLLQGKWKSIEDEQSTILFKGNIKKEFYDDEEMSSNEFELSGLCKNLTNTEATEDAGKYIFVEADDACFYIVKLTDTELELSFIGRGNTLGYSKLK